MTAIATTAALAVVVVATPVGGWASSANVWWMIPAISLFGGLCVGAAHLLVSTSLIDSPLIRLRRRIDALHDEAEALNWATPVDDSRCPPWLKSIADAVDRSECGHRARLDQMHANLREMEVQVRVADAERHHAEAILRSMVDAVLVTDAFNEIALANAAAADTLRFNLADAARQPIDRVIQDPALVKLIRDTRESGAVRQRRNIEHRISFNGRTHVYDVSLACVTGSQNEVTGVITILRDVTREREIAEMKSDFVSGVSHELRTPLSSIKAYVEMLVDGEADNEQTRNEFYNVIQSETNRLSRLIDNILNINRIEAGIVRVQREQINLAGVVSDAIEVMRPQARARQIALAESGSSLGYTIYADRDMIYQALLNLLSNAIKYTGSGGQVDVETSVDEADRTLTISVTDNGVGIPAESQAHLFEKFYRVPDHKKIAKGTGLGLNLVKHVVETVHMGRVAVRSVAGQGSTFSITLPISDLASADRDTQRRGHVV